MEELNKIKEVRDFLSISKLGMITIKRNYEIIPKLINPGFVVQGENRWIDLEEAP